MLIIPSLVLVISFLTQVTAFPVPFSYNSAESGLVLLTRGLILSRPSTQPPTFDIRDPKTPPRIPSPEIVLDRPDGYHGALIVTNPDPSQPDSDESDAPSPAPSSAPVNKRVREMERRKLRKPGPPNSPQVEEVEKLEHHQISNPPKVDRRKLKRHATVVNTVAPTVQPSTRVVA